MGVGAGGTPQWAGQTDGRLWGEEATVPCAQNWRGGGDERERPCPVQLQNQLLGGRGEGTEGVFPSKQSPMAWRKMAFHLSVVLLGGIAKGRQGSLAKWGQRINDFGARVGRDAQKGNVGVHHYCFLLGQRVGEDDRRRLRGYLGWGLWAWPRPTQGAGGSHCKPLSYGESLRQKQEEKQLGGGAAQSHAPPNGKNSNRTQSGKEGSGKWREDQALLKPQTPGWWCEYPSNTLSSQHPKFHSIAVPILESVLPGLCKMRRKTSGWGRASSLRGAGTGASHPDPPTRPCPEWLFLAGF